MRRKVYAELPFSTCFPPASFIFFVRYWFLSVFGRRIEFEMINRDIEYEFSWPRRLPEGRFEADEVARELYVFARPENLTYGIPAHWALTALCTNPRAPKPIPFDPGPIFRNDPDETRTEDPDASKGIDPQFLRMYVHDQYREFDPIPPPELSKGQRARLCN